MKFDKGAPVGYWWDGQQRKGTVLGHMHQYVLVRGGNGHQYAVKASQVWWLDENPPALEERAEPQDWPQPRSYAATMQESTPH